MWFKNCFPECTINVHVAYAKPNVPLGRIGVQGKFSEVLTLVYLMKRFGLSGVVIAKKVKTVINQKDRTYS